MPAQLEDEQETKAQDDFNLDDFAFEEEEDLSSSLKNFNFEQPSKNEIDTKYLIKELNETKKMLDSLVGTRNTEKQTEAFRKMMDGEFGDIDARFKEFVLRTISTINDFNVENLRPIYQLMENVKQEVLKAEQKADGAYQYANKIESDRLLDKLVGKSLERFFKKQTIGRNAVDHARKVHEERVQKDEGYALKTFNILNAKSIDQKKKEALMGQLVSENYRDHLLKKKNGRQDPNAPVPKKHVESDNKLEEAKEKVKEEAKEQKKAELSEEAKKKMDADFEKFRARMRG